MASTLKSILSDQIKASRPIIDDVVSDSPLTPPKADVWTNQDEACTSPDRTRIPMFISSCPPPEHSSADAKICEDEERLGGDADMLWEYDLRRGASVGLQFGEDELSGEEYEALLMEMQRALYEDLRGEFESGILIPYDSQLRKLTQLKCRCYAHAFCMPLVGPSSLEDALTILLYTFCLSVGKQNWAEARVRPLELWSDY